MTQEVSPVAKIAASVGAITLTSVCADIDIRQGEGPTIEVSAQTPSFWNVTEDGRITEVGGPVAQALKSTGTVSRSGSSVFINCSTGWMNGVFHVNNHPVVVPDPRERLVVYVPANYAGDLVIDAQYFGDISIDARLQGKVKAAVSMRVSLKMVDQTSLAAATLDASMGASITAGAITACEGRVKVTASMSGSSVTTGRIEASDFTGRAESGGKVQGQKVRCSGSADLKASMSGSSITTDDVRAADYTAKAESGGNLQGKNVRSSGTAVFEASMSGSRIDVGHVSAVKAVTKAESGGKVTGKNLSARTSVKLKASMSGSRVTMAEVWAEGLEIDGDMGGSIDVANADVLTLNAESDMSSSVTVANGSAESGRAKADMSGKINLTGDFAAIKTKESMSGRVRVTLVKGDAGDRFLRAAKRNYNRDLWDETYTGVIALTMAGSMGAAMKQGMADALADDTFVSVVCQAMGPTYSDGAVVEAVRKVGAAFGEALGPVENLSDAQLVGPALQAPAVAELFAPAFQLFLATAFKKAEAFAS